MMLVRLALFALGFAVALIAGLASDAIRHPIVTSLIVAAGLSWYLFIH